MKILLTGSSGLVGHALLKALKGDGHSLYTLVRVRSKVNDTAIYWNPRKGELDPRGLEGFDAVIHLAGANVASGRWTEAKKKEIRDSRIQSTRLLSQALVQLKKPPEVFLSASAIGFYGDRGDELLTEESPPGRGFLADLACNWEKEPDLVREAGIRVCLLRFGMILSPLGGALSKIVPLFRLGLGGRLGDGSQYVSAIGLEDVVGVIRFALSNRDLYGPINVVCPESLSNREFTRLLAKVLRRPAFLPVPAFALRLLLGEMADELLLSSARVSPKRLLELHYPFHHPTLAATLAHFFP